jgi:hypothetical protein
MHPIESRFRRRLSDWIWPEGARLRDLQAEEADRLAAEARSLLHSLWGAAKSLEYVKNDWNRLQYLLEDVGDLRAAFARAATPPA